MTLLKRTVCRRLRSAILAAALLCTTLPLTACHGSRSADPFEIPEQFDESRDYEISFWAKNDTNKQQTAVYQKAIHEFESLYPNIHVNMRLYTDYGRIYNDVITNISTNTTPNVCITYPDHIATYMTGAGTMAQLDDLMADPRYGLGGSELKFDGVTRDEIIPQFLAEGQIQDMQLALPYMRSTEALYINRDMVEKLGYEVPDVLTWDFIWEVSEKAMEQNPDGTYAVNDQKILIPFIYKSTDNMMITMLKQEQAPYSTADGEIGLFSDETRALLDTIAGHVKTGAFSTFKISGYPGNFFNAGQCIFAVDSTAGATWMGSDAPLSDIAEDKKVDFETVVRPVPQFDPAEPRMISQGPSVCLFNKEDDQEVLASWLFAQYLLTNDVQCGYAETEGYLPVTKKAQESEEYQQYLAAAGSDGNEHYGVKIAASELLMAHMSDTFVTPVFNGSASLRDAASQIVENTAKSVRRGTTLDDAYYEKMYGEVQALFHLDQSAAAGGAGTQKQDLGPLPAASKALLFVLIAAWIGIGGYSLWENRKKKS